MPFGTIYSILKTNSWRPWRLTTSGWLPSRRIRSRTRGSTGAVTRAGKNARVAANYGSGGMPSARSAALWNRWHNSIHRESGHRSPEDFSVGPVLHEHYNGEIGPLPGVFDRNFQIGREWFAATGVAHYTQPPHHGSVHEPATRILTL